MTQVLEDKNVHLSNFDRLAARHKAPAHPWLEKLRRQSIARFDLVGFKQRVTNGVAESGEKREAHRTTDG